MSNCSFADLPSELHGVIVAACDTLTARTLTFVCRPLAALALASRHAASFDSLVAEVFVEECARRRYFALFEWALRGKCASPILYSTLHEACKAYPTDPRFLRLLVSLGYPLAEHLSVFIALETHDLEIIKTCYITTDFAHLNSHPQLHRAVAEFVVASKNPELITWLVGECSHVPRVDLSASLSTACGARADRVHLMGFLQSIGYFKPVAFMEALLADNNMDEFWKHFDSLATIDFRVNKEDLGEAMARGTAHSIGNRLLTESEKQFITSDAKKYEDMSLGYLTGFSTVGNLGAIEMLIPLVASEEGEDKAAIAIDLMMHALGKNVPPETRDRVLSTALSVFGIFGLSLTSDFWHYLLVHGSPEFLSETLPKHRNDLEMDADRQFLQLLCREVDADAALVTVAELIRLEKPSLNAELVKACWQYQRGGLLDYLYKNLEAPPLFIGRSSEVERMRPSMLLFKFHQGIIRLEDLLQFPSNFCADKFGTAISECLKAGATCSSRSFFSSGIPVAVLKAIHALVPFRAEELFKEDGLPRLDKDAYLWARNNVIGMSAKMKAKCLSEAWQLSKSRLLFQFKRAGKTTQVARKLWY